MDRKSFDWKGKGSFDWKSNFNGAHEKGAAPKSGHGSLAVLAKNAPAGRF